jgi:hypothetical protein
MFFFLTCFSTCFFASVLPFLFIMALVLDRGCWGIMLQTSFFQKVLGETLIHYPCSQIIATKPPLKVMIQEPMLITPQQ